MRTARSSSHRGGGGAGPDLSQFLPWVWAWTWSPSISPLGVGLDLIPLNFPLWCGPDPPSWDQTPRTRHPPTPGPDTPHRDQTPPEQNSWHTLVKILPCPKLRLREVINPKPVAVTEWLAHLTSKREFSHSSPASYLCWNMHVGNWLLCRPYILAKVLYQRWILGNVITYMPLPSVNKAAHSGLWNP